MYFTELSMSHLAGYRLINERGELTHFYPTELREFIYGTVGT